MEDHLPVQSRNICKIISLNKELAPTIASCAKATKSKREKVCITGDSHLKQIDKRQFRKVLAKDSATLNVLVVRIPNN